MNAQVYIKRKERNLRQSDVAKAISMHEQSYYLKETGQRDFTIPEGKRLAKLYECTLDELFGDGEYESKEQTKKDTEMLNQIANHLEKIADLLKSKE